MLKVQVTETRGSGYTLVLPWGSYMLEVGEAKVIEFPSLEVLNEQLKPLVGEGVLGWMLLPESDGYGDRLWL